MSIRPAPLRFLLPALALVVSACSDDGVTDPDGLGPGEFRLELEGALNESVSGTASLTSGSFDGSEDRPVVRLTWTDRDGTWRFLILVFSDPEHPVAGQYQASRSLTLEGPMADTEVRAWLATRISDTQLDITRVALQGHVRVDDPRDIAGSVDLSFAPAVEDATSADTRVLGEFRVR